ncbi:MAG: TetR/AcrR family transcriptional regulator [Dehalococcoidia bacterium]
MSITKKSLQSESTRRELLEVARGLFTERGYADTPLEEIVQRAGVTRGALYHHFKDKEDLFRAVHVDVAGGVHSRVIAAIQAAPDPWRSLLDGCLTYLDNCMDPAVQRIVLVDGQAVLGESHYDEAGPKDVEMVAEGFQEAMDAGLVPRQPPRPLALLLLGALKEAAMAIIQAPDKVQARAEMGDALRRVLEGLRTR